MKLPIAQKFSLCLLAVATAATLCVLPFLAAYKETIYLYTRDAHPNSREQGFANELKRLGYEVKLNTSDMPLPNSIGVWFKKSEYVKEINRSQAKYNFIYNEDYYPLNGQEIQTQLIVLTPYQDLYEHYVRSNIKSAQFILGVNLSDFYINQQNFAKEYKTYPLVYYGDNNKSSPLAEKLRKESNVKFIGRFWENDDKVLINGDVKDSERGRLLSKANIVSVYNEPNSADSKIISPEIMEATASGCLVISSPNKMAKEIYGDSIIIYENLDDFSKLASYYLNQPDIVREKVIKAQKITAEKLSSATSAQRLNEIIKWLNQNRKSDKN